MAGIKASSPADTPTTSTKNTVPTEAPPEPPALTCGVPDGLYPALTEGPGFTTCKARWAIRNFCSTPIPTDVDPLRPGFNTRIRYYPVNEDAGILIARGDHLIPEKCVDSSKPPDPAEWCGSGCDEVCYAILGGIMNDCQTETISEKKVSFHHDAMRLIANSL